MHQDSEKAAARIRERIGDTRIDVGLVLSAGLAAIADLIAAPISFKYDELPGFIVPRFVTQSAECAIGRLGTCRVAVLKGQTRYHEHGHPDGMRVPLETLKLLGASAVVLTGAAGSTRREISPGSFVAIRDHLNLTGINPLIGQDGENRAVDLSAAYDPHLRERFAAAAGELGRKTSEGTLMWFPGPSYETPAEINAARLLGADLVGMSIVPETIISRHLGLRVFAVATVTNYAAGLGSQLLGREQSMRVSAASTVSLTRILVKFMERWIIDTRVM